MSEHPISLVFTGASGVVSGQLLLEVLLDSDVDIHLTISDSARVVTKHELNLDLDLDDFEVRQLIPGYIGTRTIEYYKNFMALMASGSFKTRGMVVCPCSGGTMSGIAEAAYFGSARSSAFVDSDRQSLYVLRRRSDDPAGFAWFLSWNQFNQRPGRFYCSADSGSSGHWARIGSTWGL